MAVDSRGEVDEAVEVVESEVGEGEGEATALTGVAVSTPRQAMLTVRRRRALARRRSRGIALSPKNWRSALMTA